MPDAEAADIERVARFVARSFGLQEQGAPRVLHYGRGDRIRVGYVSADLRRHPVGDALALVLREHERARFDVHVFDSTQRIDEATSQLQAIGHSWHRIANLADESVVRLIRNAGIDVLVDLSGHTRDARLSVFARNPALHQLSWLGFPGAIGLESIPWQVVDRYTVPDGLPFPGGARPLRLPRVFACYAPPLPRQPADPALCEVSTVFGSVHKFEKLNLDVIDCWARVLAGDPSSRLLLARDDLDPIVARNLVRQFGRRGIDPARIDIRRLERGGANVDATLEEIDILLDVFPWSGHTMCCFALSRGVPVVSLAGRFHAGRMVASVLSAAGLQDMVAASVDDYVRIASSMAANRRQLRRTRHERSTGFRASIVCDGEAFTRDLESAFVSLVEHRVDA